MWLKKYYPSSISNEYRTSKVVKNTITCSIWEYIWIYDLTKISVTSVVKRLLEPQGSIEIYNYLLTFLLRINAYVYIHDNNILQNSSNTI